MKYLSILFFAVVVLIFNGCCGSDLAVGEFCENQVFVESRIAPVEFTYTVNTSQKFFQGHRLTSENLRKALKIEGSNFKVRKMGLTSAFMAYKKEVDNDAAAMFVNIGAVDNSLGLVLLMKKDQFVPLVDVPSIGFTPEVNINKLLNENGVKEISKLLEVYAEVLNDEGLDFILSGEASPKGQKMHFQVKVKMNISVEYEICRYLPLGAGLRLCE